MRYCHECGAEVAPVDIFCAFCGVALQPVSTASADASDSSALAAKTTEPSIAAAPETKTSISSQFSAENTKELETFETDEPETILRSDKSLNLSLTHSESEKTGESIESNSAALGGAPLLRAQSTSPAAEADEPYIATIPNAALESFAHEAGVPIEELRQDEIDVAEPTQLSSPPESKTAREQIELKSEIQPTDRIRAEDEIAEPVSLVEPEFAAQETAAPEFSAPIDSEMPGTSAPESELVSNSSDTAVPRPTESNQPKDTTGGKSPKLKPLEEGTVLNRRYEIIRRVGGGGMGAVYLASDRNLGGVMRAVKEMIQAYVDEAQHEKAVEDFKREALLLSSLEHPAIPTIYDYFVDADENRFYLVMKYISGGDLAARFRAAPNGKIDEQTMTEWAIQIADVLDYLHNHEPPIVYRDLKPSNVMIDGKTGRVMLVDFGIARWVNREEKGNTAVGTMGYAPSEQYAGNSEPRSDIYALGATMFHLLTAADPQNNPLLIFDFTKNPRPRQINPNLSVEMERILTRAVEYNANMRFGSAAEMRNALLDHLERIRAGKLTFAAPENTTAAATAVSQSAPTAAAAKLPVGTAFCGFCGERIAANDVFCAYCGSKQPEADRVRAAAQVAFPANKATARLVVETGAFDEPAFVLEKENNILGREDRRSNIFPEIDLTKYDVASPKISRRHARIWRQGTSFMIEDLGSANGTTLVSHDSKIIKLLANQPHVLMHGDKLKLGETTLHFFVN